MLQKSDGNYCKALILLINPCHVHITVGLLVMVYVHEEFWNKNHNGELLAKVKGGARS